MPGSLFLILLLCIYASSMLTLVTPATEHPSACSLVLFILGGDQLIRPDIGNWFSHFFFISAILLDRNEQSPIILQIFGSMCVDFQDSVQALHHYKHKARYTWVNLRAVRSANHWKS